jgi:uncharacterized membrane protein (UPF0127 family)
MAEVQVENSTRGRTVATDVRVADSFIKRLRGLIGSRPLKQGEGLLIIPSNSIHTHFMGFPIDVLFVDQDQKIVAIQHELSPWRLGQTHKQARFVIELPAGTAAQSGTQPGDQLQVRGYDVSR